MSSSQADVSPGMNRVIWVYFIGLAVGLYLIIAGLTLYFSMALESERHTKIGAIQSDELIKLKQYEQDILTGKKGVVEGKKFIPIDQAIDQYVSLQKK